MKILHLLATPWLTWMNWLHTRWPAGTVEKLPEVQEGGITNIPGLRIAGDLNGVPLLKFAVDSGVKAVRAFADELSNRSKISSNDPDVYDIAIVGGGVAGVAAAIEAKKLGLSFKIFEAAKPFATVADFPKGKPIFTYPVDLTPPGDFQVSAPIKEELIEEMEAQRLKAGVELTEGRVEQVTRRDGLLQLDLGKGTPPCRARRVLVAIGRSGNFRKLGCPGESLPKVFNRLHDPKEFCGRAVMVVGGGDSALESAIALATCGANVTLSYRKKEFSRPKPGNLEMIKALQENPEAPVSVEHPTSERVTTAASHRMRGDKPAGRLQLALGTTVQEVRESEVILRDSSGKDQVVPNDVVFSMIGREPPLDFFRRSGVAISGEWRTSTWVSFIAFFIFCCWMYTWKTGTPVNKWFKEQGWFPYNVPDWFASWMASADTPGTLAAILKINLGEPGFYYTFIYSSLILIFGLRRMKRRKTPYINVQTWTLILVQAIPLFFLPYLILPWMGGNGWFDSGWLKSVADELFPAVNYGHGREYWRAFGLILAWPLFIWNVFSNQPMWGWLAISLLQTFVIIPLIVWRWGKGAYCGWLCSCGALAETVGDLHRHKMPHGPFWNRLNMAGQVILIFAFIILGFRIFSWIWPEGFARESYRLLLSNLPLLNYVHFVDLFLAGIIGVGLYFWFSGRVWCRFFCPLAALMHIYARFSEFRIFPKKEKCISCNVCTSVCHQGIDIMNFANKGLPMEDPECVRCSACVQSCPTGVLSFGRLKADGNIILDRLKASSVDR